MKIDLIRSYVLAAALIALISACGSKSNSGQLSSEDQIKLEQYMIQGERLYQKHCSACHQADGSGFARIYPPLNPSDYVDQDLERTICITKNGIKGEIMVNGVSYNQPMAGIAELTPLEVAEITTFVYNSWRRNQGLISVNEVKKVLNQCIENRKSTDF